MKRQEELRARLGEIQTRLQEIDTQYAGEALPEKERSEFEALREERKDTERLIAELETREAWVAEGAADPERQEEGATFQTARPSAVRGEDIYDLSTVRRSYGDPGVEGTELRDRSRRAVELARFPHERARHEEVQTRLEGLIERIDDEQGSFSRYLLLTGSPTYKRAFTKYLAGQSRSQEEDGLLERAASLTTTAGGFAVPFVLDPTVIQTGSGAINPYRVIGNVSQINVDEWRGVSSDGITATFQAEAAAVTDATPTLAQPVVSTEMARAFVPFSIEIGQDWSAFASEMAGMISDSKDVLEATKFAVGSGTNEPFGVITGATTVYTASATNALGVYDIYGVRNALGPRFRARAVWALNNGIADRVRQFDTAGGASLWVDNLRLRSAAGAETMQDARLGADLLGHAAYESSALSGTMTTGQLIGVIGDFGRYYKIIDRIGLTVETIPHIFGASQGNLPTGQRGLFAYWRVGAKVLHANAFRVLKLA
jgi:HK97 family phage major capsid protein